MILNGLLFTIGHKSFFKEQSQLALLSSFSHIKIKSIVKNSLSVDKRSILIDRHDVTFSVPCDIQTGVGLNSLTVAKSKDKLLGILQLFCRKSCHSGLFICNALSGGFKGFNGALLLCAPIWQWRLSGSLRCKHSCTYRMTLLIYKKVVSVLNRVDDTRQFFALPTLEVELEVLAELSNQR